MNDQNKNIVIKEQDLFCYIFFPESVPDKKKKMIETNNSFNEVLEFYKQMKLNSDKKPNESLKRKIANKIPAYSLSNVIKLYALKETAKPRQNGYHLAAASTELKPKMTTKTFVDNDKEYLIKILNYGDKTKVFVFSTKDEVVKNFDIIIEPDNLKFHLEDNSEPLKINHLIDAEKIEIRFQ
jgi:hypothetical protein